jgi:hypothetical protein
MAKRAPRHPHQHRLAGLGDKDGGLVLHAVLFAQAQDEVVALRAVLPDAQFDPGAAHHLGRGVAGDALEGLVDHGVAPGGQVGERDDVGAGGHQVRQHGLGPAHRFFGGAALGVVDIDRQHGGAVVGVHTHAGGPHRHAPAHAAGDAEVGDRQALARGQVVEVVDAAALAFARVAAFVAGQQVAADHGAERVIAEQRHAGRVGVNHAAGAVHHQRRGDAREQLLVAGFGGRQRLPRLQVGGDVAHHAPVAAEHTTFVEARLAADAEVAHRAAGAAPLDGQVAERRACVQVGLQQVERLVVAGKLRQVPGHLAQAVAGRQAEAAAALAGAGHQAVLLVDFPVGVGGNRQQAAEAVLTLVGGAHVARHHAGDHQPAHHAAHQQQQVDDQPQHGLRVGQHRQRHGRRVQVDTHQGQRHHAHHRQGHAAPRQRAQDAGQQREQRQPGPAQAPADKDRGQRHGDDRQRHHAQRACHASRRAPWPSASPPCAPTPGISSGSVGASARTRSISHPERWRPPPGRAGRCGSRGRRPAGDVLVQQLPGCRRSTSRRWACRSLAAGVGGAAQQEQALAVVGQVGLDRVEAHEGRQRDRVGAVALEGLARVLLGGAADVAALGVQDHRHRRRHAADVLHQPLELVFGAVRGEVGDLRLEGAHQVVPWRRRWRRRSRRCGWRRPCPRERAGKLRGLRVQPDAQHGPHRHPLAPLRAYGVRLQAVHPLERLVVDFQLQASSRPWPWPMPRPGPTGRASTCRTRPCRRRRRRPGSPRSWRRRSARRPSSS